MSRDKGPASQLLYALVLQALARKSVDDDCGALMHSSQTLAARVSAAAMLGCKLKLLAVLPTTITFCFHRGKIDSGLRATRFCDRATTTEHLRLLQIPTRSPGTSCFFFLSSSSCMYLSTPVTSRRPSTVTDHHLHLHLHLRTLTGVIADVREVPTETLLLLVAN